MAKQVEQLEKEKKELQERLKNQEKKVTEWFISENISHLDVNWTLTFLSLQIDYFERAKRLEEIPLIKKAYEEQRIKDMELWELQEEDRVCRKKTTSDWKNTSIDQRIVIHPGEYPECTNCFFFHFVVDQ